jgi:hypothetical protein
MLGCIQLSWKYKCYSRRLPHLLCAGSHSEPVQGAKEVKIR